ncbi:hypothetical protein [Rossellomorea sp. YZS02]|uniref:hypothetical protein n=1 Tax=Rossellomorea sp. YZS02 TaxID=3097358 RepID=UPI002A11A571|nr:hypothetical protein [Rossellomorea sp. YZS02]MDX8342420.1 hypothetical protein [Rossellomorea sp. YZS02]
MQATFYTMKMLLLFTVPFFLIALAFVTVTGMYIDSVDITLPVFLMESIGMFLFFLLICFIIHAGFHLLNRRFSFMKAGHYIALRVVSIICFFIPLGGVMILFFILFPLSFQLRE